MVEPATIDAAEEALSIEVAPEGGETAADEAKVESEPLAESAAPVEEAGDLQLEAKEAEGPDETVIEDQIAPEAEDAAIDTPALQIFNTPPKDHVPTLHLKTPMPP